MIRFFQFGGYTAYPVQHDWWYLVKIYHGWVFMQNHFEESHGPQKHRQKGNLRLSCNEFVWRANTQLCLGGWGGWCILLSLYFYWYSGKYKRCKLNKSEECPTLGGQCPVSVSVRLGTLGKTWRDSWSYLSLLFIVPVTPPTVPTEVQTFCPPLWSFAQRFAQCTAHCSLLR